MSQLSASNTFDGLKKALDKVDILASLVLFSSLLGLPILTYQPNRLTSGTGKYLFDIFPFMFAVLIILAFLFSFFVILKNTSFYLAIAVVTAAMGGLFYMVGAGAAYVLPDQIGFARVSLGSGFWVASIALWLVFANNILKLRASPLFHVAIFIFMSLLFGGMIYAGLWNKLSLMIEYKNEIAFWSHAQRHIFLSLASLIPAIMLGLPMGVLSAKSSFIKSILFPILNILQTIPSIAMFGILMIPLTYLATNYPSLAELGIRGIGAAPAVVALFFYSLLPIVSNTAIGISKLEPQIIEAARGMGMSSRQRLLRVELPLATPIILTGIRIVLIQNIGIVAVAGLIGGGGFGTYIFKGLNQTATELVMLGALPTLYLAFFAAIIMDSLIGLSKRKTDA